MLRLKRKDKETGLHYNRYRYYEPHSARYISKDPIGLDGGFHETSYIKNPNGWVDPMGLAGEAVLDKVFSGVKLLSNSPAGILVRVVLLSMAQQELVRDLIRHYPLLSVDVLEV